MWYEIAMNLKVRATIDLVDYENPMIPYVCYENLMTNISYM